MSQAGKKVLIVDDEQAIRRFLRATLSAHGYTITEAGTARQALELCAREHPDLVILDLGLPDMEGIEVTRRIREWSQVPVIILSVREREADKVAALDAGADDYLTKPFGVEELMARLRVALRRATQPGADPLFQSGDLLFDAARRLVTMGGQELQLTPTEYELLRVLVQHAGRVLTHRQLLQEVWGPAYASETHLLRVNISNLRRKLEPDPSRPRYILTEPGVGYRLHVLV
jgi:two-component system, OmpR family, KDP operon response regulator KdpE